MNIPLQLGVFLVKLARASVEEFLLYNRIKQIKVYDDRLLVKRGAFTTIESYQRKGNSVARELRGCIGFPYPTYELYNSVIKSAILAAVEDPRFPPLKVEELDKVTFEVSILTEPTFLDVDKRDVPKYIKVGRDGLIIEYGLNSGLLLPQVAVENEWDEESFLSNACLKAGLPPDAWIWKKTKIYKFQAELFGELEPKGKIIRKEIYKRFANV